MLQTKLRPLPGDMIRILCMIIVQVPSTFLFIYVSEVEKLTYMYLAKLLHLVLYNREW